MKRNFQNFDKSSSYDLLKQFIDSVENYNKNSKYIVTSDYTVDMALIFSKYMANEFIKLMQEVRERENPMISFQMSRATYFDAFLAQYKDISGDEVAAKHLCQVLTVAIEVAVKETLPTHIVDKMKISDPSYNRKNQFKVKILKDLAKLKKFDLFTTYLIDIKSSFEYWAKLYVNEFCMANGKENIKSIVGSIVHKIVLQIYAVIAKLDSDLTIKQWWQLFHKYLNETLKLDLAEIQDIIEATHPTSSS